MNILSATYTEHGFIAVVTDDGITVVPDDMADRHRRMIAEWVSAGNVIAPPITPPPTLDDYQRAIQTHIDETARSKNYESGFACATYANSTNALWAAESSAFIAWRDDVWAYAYGEMDKVTGGLRTAPSVEDFISELPEIDWPA